jgi:phthiocerol/phenolphthiocerol synthesis type-I polyketide synthase C
MSDGSIAIIGASCRFPGADGLDAFWELLSSGRDAVSEVDERRWSTRFYFHPNRAEPGKSYTWAAGLISDVDHFEPSFFGISPREAAQMDPQQRLLLELVWHALEDAGIPAGSLSGSEIGVYIGASSTDYSDLRLGDPAGGDSYFMTGNTLSILANRISYIFDLRGPSLTVDTACSSSLVALHHACEAIRGNRIDSAIVGGINLLLAPYPFLGFCRASMLSRRGRCFAFDERADGYVRGEGGGVVILKPLAAALAAGDLVRAVIHGSGVNSDGRTIGLSLPSEAAQAALLRAVYERAEVAPDDLAFFEMHGTGTPAGDPIEAAAVGRALGQSRSAPLPIGSVKTNIGHLEPASGMAGLIKAALALERGVVPPTLHCEAPNPNIAFDRLNLRLVRSVEPIVPDRRLHHAGINSFGFGGTNAHIVLSAPPRRETSLDAAAVRPPLMISARSEGSLSALAQRWRNLLATTPPERLPTLLRAAARRRDQHPHRLVVLQEDPLAAAEELAEFCGGSSSPDIVAGTAVREGKLAFVYSGNGAQWPAMGRTALATNPDFRAAVEEVDAIMRPNLGWSVSDALAEGVDAERMARADVAQPLLFAVQVGIVRALQSRGITASGHVGHSVGEIAAAWGAGALPLADAVRVVLARSRQQQRTQGDGRMAALVLSGEASHELIAELNSPVEIGAFNATQSVTLSGPGEEIDRLGTEARRRGIAFRALDLDFAFHSRAMDPIRDDLLAELDGLASQRPETRLLSTVTGEAVESEALDAEYWWRNIRHPVRFSEAMRQLIEEGYRIFVEIGPNPVLQSYLNDGLRSAEVEGRVLGTLSRKDGDGDPFPTIAARCYVAGHDLSCSPIFDGPADPRGLPLYPWQRERFWFEKTAEAADTTSPRFEHPLLGFRQRGPVLSWLNHIDEDLLPWIADHAIEGVPVLPAAAILEMAFAAARSRWADAPVLEVLDVEIRRPLPFEKGRIRELRTTLPDEDGDWELASRPRLSSEPPTVHAVGRLSAATDPHRIVQDGDAATVARQLSAEALYLLAHRAGLDYGGCFRTVERIEITGTDTAIAYLDASCISEPLEPYLIHPALFDGALQGLLALLAERQEELDGVSFLPWRFARARLAAPFGRIPRLACLRLTRIGIRSASADIALFDEAGNVVAELADCWFRRVALRRGSIEERTLRVELVPQPLTESDSSVAEIGSRIAGLAVARAPDGTQREQALLLDALIAAVALQSLRRIDPPAESFTVAELIEAGSIAAGSSALAESLLRLLERFGGASEDEGHWRLLPGVDLPEVSEVWRLLLAEAPDLVAELALVSAAVEDLPKILSEGLNQADSSSPQLVEHLLQASPASSPSVGLLCDALGEIAEAWPKEKPLRILELGAGSGGATRRMLDRLARSGVSLIYLATSTDAEQSARLSFGIESYIGAAARHWAPQHGIEELDGARFDIVVAVNACARLQLDPEELMKLNQVLNPGGLFVAVEPEPNPLWDVVFGRSPGWWQSIGSSPLRAGEEWRSELTAAGFISAGSAPTASLPWPSAILWATAPPQSVTAAAEPAQAVPLLMVGAQDAETMTSLLAATGNRVRCLSDREAVLSERTEASAEEPLTVLFFAEFGEGMDCDAAADELARFARIAAAAAEQNRPLWLVTCDAHQATVPQPHAGIGGAALWGLARVLVNEMPRLSLRLVDLPKAFGTEERAMRIAAELAAGSAESEVVWTPKGRHVLRLRRGLPPRWASPSDELTLSSSHPGGLDSLGWARRRPQTVGPGAVEIEVHAAGLNFRDMMWAMGLLPEEALIDGFSGPTFGLECAGTVRSLGEGVEGLAVGDRVMALAPASLSTRVVTVADAVAKIPDETSFAAAATIPVTFVTVIYALGHLAKLMPGEHVLIHAAAGGVGLSAIQYAKHRGGIVIATAGSEVKRAFLRLAGADYVLNSRDLGFADAVREITGGQGVDIVLNSLSGEAMEQSLGVLKPFGRFLELGKRDFYLNRRIHLRPLRQNISYFAIDVDQLPVQRPDLARALLSEVSTALKEGAIRPIAHRVFSFAELDDAFRLMQSAGHIGKIVLVPDGNAGVQLREPAEFIARHDGVYLVTGGLDGFGYEAARWLVARGARALALVSRRGLATPGSETRIEELRAAGASVSVYSADVADPDALAVVLAAIHAEGRPLRGVVHAASAIDDRLAAHLDASNILPVLQAKLGGALALDSLTRDEPVELFLLFSSATTLLGAPGQGAYVAANLALEALARRRRAEGRSALAVAWGPIEDAGYLAERPETRDQLARRLGAKPMPAAQALSGLPAMAGSGLPMAALAETSWTEARRFLPILATSLFSEIRSKTASSPSDEPLGDRLASLNPEQALALLKTVVAEEAANILRLPAGGIDAMRPLSEAGMDSLMAVELRLALESRLRIDLPLVSLAEGTSVASLATRLAAALAVGPKHDDVVALTQRHEMAEALLPDSVGVREIEEKSFAAE